MFGFDHETVPSVVFALRYPPEVFALIPFQVTYPSASVRK